MNKWVYNTLMLLFLLSFLGSIYLDDVLIRRYTVLGCLVGVIVVQGIRRKLLGLSLITWTGISLKNLRRMHFE